MKRQSVTRYSVTTVAVIAFLIGLILGIWVVRYGTSFPMFSQKEQGRWADEECPSGMRKHFNEMRGDYGCVPDDYVGI